MLNTIALLIPVFLFIVGIEWLISIKRGDNKYTVKNTVMNMAIGALDQIGSLIYFGALFMALNYSSTHFQLFEMKMNWQQWGLAFFAIDFLSYWYHRVSHRVNIFWAGHVTHHSSELFNLSNSFRTSLFQGVNRIAFWSILPIFGFSPLVLLITLKASGIYEFFLHSAYSPKMGFLGKILITPSLHKVHHGKNDIYIDKNYGSVFVIWDKLFGTFQEETETVVFGIKGDYVDNHPLLALGHHYIYLIKMVRGTHKFSDKVKLLFMPPGWVPENVESMPPKRIGKPKEASEWRPFALFQLACAVPGFILFMVYHPVLSFSEVLVCAMTIAFSMVNASLILNKNIPARFAKHENARIVLTMIAVLLVLTTHHRYYLILILFYLLLNLACLGLSRSGVTRYRGSY